MDIKCRKTLCKHNNHFSCKKKGININNDTICKSFEKADKNVCDSSQLIFLKKVRYAPFRNTKTLKIDCQATCLFNKNGECFANGILINEKKEKPYCQTNAPIV